MTTGTRHSLVGTRFGAIEFEEEDLILFEHGLIGFPHARRFVVVCTRDDSPFRWLQSADEPALAFLVTDPARYVPTYAPALSDGLAKDLRLVEETPRLVFVTANIPAGKPEAMTLNLAGPIVVNAESRKARQVVLEDEAYTTRHRVFPDSKATGSRAA